MKKLLLTLSAVAVCAWSANAQRLSLYEEFTGENCGPCAATNPGLWTLISAPGNASKVIMIKYMSPIPSAGQFYYQNKTQTDARLNYYGVPFAPYGRMDGKIPANGCTSPGHPGCLTQTDIDNASSVTSPFTITVTGNWNPTYDSVTANISVTATSAYAPAGGNVKLRVALVQDVYWPFAPGTNGEKTFENVVRRMYPDANGTSISASWSMGATNNYTIRGAVPNYVDKSNNPYFVVWIQNDVDSVVAQAAISAPLASTLAVDVASDSLSWSDNSTFYCNSFSPGVVIANKGTTPLTSATIYYKVDNGSWSTQSWTGTLAPGASTNVSLPITTSGYHQVYDSVVTAGDMNLGNSNSYGYYFLNTPGAYSYSQINTGFETELPNGYYAMLNNDGWSWYRGSSSSVHVGHGGSSYVMFFPNFQPTGSEQTYLIVPTPTISGDVTLNWWVAYAQQTSSNNDQLDVVYSTDCGSTWTSIWSKSGNTLATAPPSVITSTGGAFLPTSDADWRQESVSLSSLPSNAMLAFKNTSNGGNYVFIDDVDMQPYRLDVHNVANANNAWTIYPNPAKDAATLDITLSEATNVQVEVLDALGRTVSTIANQNMTAGEQKITINTASLTAGVYNVRVTTGTSTAVQKLNVIK